MNEQKCYEYLVDILHPGSLGYLACLHAGWACEDTSTWSRAPGVLSLCSRLNLQRIYDNPVTRYPLHPLSDRADHEWAHNLQAVTLGLWRHTVRPMNQKNSRWKVLGTSHPEILFTVGRASIDAVRASCDAIL